MLKRLKQQGGFYNRQQQTLAGLLAGRDQPLRERLDWGRMRMDPTDIADVTGSTYTYCINGHDSAANWTGLYAPGERVRLRVINAAAMTNFNVRVPGLPMRVVAADGQDVVPVETDEFQIGIAETLDVIVQPGGGQGLNLRPLQSWPKPSTGRASAGPRWRRSLPPVWWRRSRHAGRGRS
ncbi:hypothetical protein ACFS32_23250 [Novosphingobium pokkalii]|uniref:hypothetical protein n=1 Tax=Novosphingobium pokkalii TaxID=1770194 RepID=UPI00363F7353